MYIKYENLVEWAKSVEDMEKGLSPGGLANKIGVTRQTINNWINSDVIDAHTFDSESGVYVMIDADTEMNKILRYKERK